MIRQVTSGQPQRTLRVEGSDAYAGDGIVYCPVDSATVIEIGDLLYLDTDDAKPASSQADVGSESLNQQVFHDVFLGIALGRSRAGQTADIPVATKGLFEADCPSGTFELGALVGASENTTGDGLLSQQVESVASANLAIGRVARRLNPAGTRVLVDIISSMMNGGPMRIFTPGAALTTQLTTITHTAPGADDFAVQNLTQTTPFGFVTADEGNTVLKVIANLQTRLAEVEARMESLKLVQPN